MESNQEGSRRPDHQASLGVDICGTLRVLMSSLGWLTLGLLASSPTGVTLISVMPVGEKRKHCFNVQGINILKELTRGLRIS